MFLFHAHNTFLWNLTIQSSSSPFHSHKFHLSQNQSQTKRCLKQEKMNFFHIFHLFLTYISSLTFIISLSFTLIIHENLFSSPNKNHKCQIVLLKLHKKHFLFSMMCSSTLILYPNLKSNLFSFPCFISLWFTSNSGCSSWFRWVYIYVSSVCINFWDSRLYSMFDVFLSGIKWINDFMPIRKLHFPWTFVTLWHTVC